MAEEKKFSLFNEQGVAEFRDHLAQGAINGSLTAKQLDASNTLIKGVYAGETVRLKYLNFLFEFFKKSGSDQEEVQRRVIGAMPKFFNRTPEMFSLPPQKALKDGR